MEVLIINAPGAATASLGTSVGRSLTQKPESWGDPVLLGAAEIEIWTRELHSSQARFTVRLSQSPRRFQTPRRQVPPICASADLKRFPMANGAPG